MQDSSSALIEPLEVSAPLAREFAAASCARIAAGRSCEPYHRFWQYMRLMGLGKTLSGLGARYVTTLEQFARDWAQRRAALPPKVLISGCADYSIAAHVLHAFGNVNQRLDLTALDICQTPLSLNQWYALRIGQSLAVVCSDILDYRPAATYDLIVTNSFLGYFNPGIRPRVFQGYASTLREGGRLIVVNRMRDGPESEAVGFTPDQIERFAARATQLSARLPASARLAPEDAHRMARAYGEYFSAYPVNSEETIMRLAASSGLRRVDGARLPSVRLQQGIEGPTLGDGSDYLFAILEK